MSDPVTEVPIVEEGPAETTSQPLSKKAQKKLAKAASLAEKKKERRANEKEKRKEKKRKLAEQKATGEIDEAEYARLTKKVKIEQKPPFQARVVVDLGFDNLMTENEVKSLTSQLAYTYSANRKAVQPFSTVLFTSINGKTQTRLDSMNDGAYKRWHSTEWWSDSYERLWQTSDDSTPQNDKPANQTQTTTQESVIYLTADSSDELSELKEGETYIIGGICDHNRYKNLCFKKSQDTGIRSARLPIGTYLSELKTRHVLTVNQTFEILLKWVETRDWEEALYSVIPKRKFHNKSGDQPGDQQVVVDTAEVEAEGCEDSRGPEITDDHKASDDAVSSTSPSVDEHLKTTQ